MDANNTCVHALVAYLPGVDLGKAQYTDIDIKICILDYANHFLINLHDNLRSQQGR